MKENPIIPKVWITQYALTQGIYSRENVEHCLAVSPDGNMISNRAPGGTYSQCYHKPHWHLTEEEANAQARKMIAAKRKSIEKQLAKLDKLAKEYA